MTVSPDGRSAYVASFTSDAVAVFARDLVTGGANSVTLSPDGRSAYVASEDDDALQVFRRDLKTGQLSQLRDRAGCVSQGGREGCAAGRGLAGADDVAVSLDGRSAYVASGDAEAVAVFGRDRKTGRLRQLPDEAGCLSQGEREGCARGRAIALPIAVALSSDGRSAYVASLGSDAVAVFARRQSTNRIRFTG